MKYTENIHRGFTLVEMMVVLALAAILLVSVIANGGKQKRVARDKVRVADIQTIRLALEEYKLSCGEYPSALDTSANNGHCPSGVTLGSYLKHIPTVPNYATEFHYPDQGQNYFYYGMTSRLTNRKCFDYIVGVQLEGNANSEYLSEVNGSDLVADSSHSYAYECNGLGVVGIENADNPDYSVYGFRSSTNTY